MVIECGNGYILYISTEEFFILTDEEFDELIKTHCFPSYDPFYTNQKSITFMEGIFDDDIPHKDLNINEILSILDTEPLDLTDYRDKIFLDDEESKRLLDEISDDDDEW